MKTYLIIFSIFISTISFSQDTIQSEAWQRKRYVVLKRDNWTCVYCGNGATHVMTKFTERKK